MSLVRVEGVTKQYQLGNQTVVALHDITLSFDEGVFLAIAGPSGSGKSTLLNIIGCIDTPTTGKIFIDDVDVTGRSADELADLRARTTGFIFQSFNLFPVLTAAENVEYPLLNLPEISREERKQRVKKFLGVVGLERFADHKPNQLSGGQRQRVAIARALAIKPRIVLADEPTANLDRKTGESILSLMKDINRHYGTTFIFSTHDRRVMAMADRLIRIEDGQVSSLGLKVNEKWQTVRPDNRDNGFRGGKHESKVGTGNLDNHAGRNDGGGHSGGN
jgi:putative ABC transport system ATP-binding protein